MPSESEVLPPPGVEAHIFWEQHKNKIILYSALLIVALVIFAVYQYSLQQRDDASSALLAHAAKADDYKAVIEKYPRTVAAGNAHLLLAKSLRDDKKFDDAIQVLRQFTERFPEHPLSSAGWLSLAETQHAAGKTDDAVSTYQQVISKFPDSFTAPLAALEQANLLREKGKTDEAKRAYENVFAQYPESFFAQQARREMRLLKK